MGRIGVETGAHGRSWKDGAVDRIEVEWNGYPNLARGRAVRGESRMGVGKPHVTADEHNPQELESSKAGIESAPTEAMPQE